MIWFCLHRKRKLLQTKYRRATTEMLWSGSFVDRARFYGFTILYFQCLKCGDITTKEILGELDKDSIVLAEYDYPMGKK